VALDPKCSGFGLEEPFTAKIGGFPLKINSWAISGKFGGDDQSSQENRHLEQMHTAGMGNEKTKAVIDILD